MAAATAMQERSTGEKSHLSREINRAVELDARMKEDSKELKELKETILELTGRQPGTFRGSKGFAEVGASNALSIPAENRAALMAALGDDYTVLVQEDVSLTVPIANRAALQEALGDQYHALIQEDVDLKVTGPLKDLLLNPEPGLKSLSYELRDLVTIKTTLSFRLRAA